MSQLTIGKVAQQAGVNLQTIRYYQRQKLIEQPPKPIDGYRVYDEAVVNRVRFIKRTQLLGFSLKEVKELLSLGDGHCEDVQALAQDKRDRIQAQIDDLECMKSALDSYLSSCKRNKDPGHCSMINALYSGLACESGDASNDEHRGAT